MKKALTVAVLFVMLMAVAMTAVYASTFKTLSNDLYAIGSKYGMNAEYKNQVDMVLSSVGELSDADCDRIVALANDAAKIMDDNGLKNYDEIKAASTEIKNQLKSLAVEAGNIAGVSLVFKSANVEAYNKATGKLITTLTQSEKAAYTGSNATVAISLTVIALIAISAIVTKKRLAA